MKIIAGLFAVTLVVLFSVASIHNTVFSHHHDKHQIQKADDKSLNTSQYDSDEEETMPQEDEDNDSSKESSDENKDDNSVDEYNYGDDD